MPVINCSKIEIGAMKLPSLPTLLSFNGGYVDTLGFLSLSGLFTAHVTGNFVTLGATAALGLGGALSKLLALPVFCLVVFLSRLACLKLQAPVAHPSARCFSSSLLCLRAWRSSRFTTVLSMRMKAR